MAKNTLHTQKSATDGPSVNPKFQAGKRPAWSVEELERAILVGDRAALAAGITLVESEVAEDVVKAGALLEKLLPHAGNSVRLGISGVPGVGKSTFLESYGVHYLESNEKARLAVLAIDPSSSRSHGAILGDKTRMVALGRHERAFIRPTASSGALGGVARATKAAIVLCEAAGYTHVFVETVGVGQSETAVSQMVDAFLFLAMPGTGDELQGIKKGIMEMADLIAINKSEGERAPAAKRTRVELQRALQLSTRDEFNWTPTITLISALESQGFEELDAAIDQCIRHSRAQGWFDEKRRRQAEYWYEVEVQHALRSVLQQHHGLQAAYEALRAKVGQSELGPLQASKLFIEELRRRLDR